MNISYLIYRNTKFIKLFFVVIVTAVIVISGMFSHVAFAQQGGGGVPGQGGGGTPPAETEEGAGDVDAMLKLKNPLEGTVDTLPALVKSLLNIVMIIGTPLVALAIIYAGFMLVAAQGNAEKLTKARQALLWGIVGGAVLLGAYILAQAIGGTVEQLTQ